MNKKEMMQLKTSLTMPPELAATLIEGCNAPEKRHLRGHIHRNLCAAAAACFCLLAVGSTSFAYNVYQEKQLAVFMEADLSQAEIDYIGEKIADIYGISSCRYISGDEAWREFKAAYLTDENGKEIADFKENPLTDSFNYHVSVRINADTQAVREQISELHGVRKITTLQEAERADRSACPTAIPQSR